MIVIIGLGNPGKKFKKTRHNLGFWVVDQLKKTYSSFSFWQKTKLALLKETRIKNKKVVLVKPLTFMNESGKAVVFVLKKYNLLPKDLWVVHDDLNLEAGKIKISFNKGAGGHI